MVAGSTPRRTGSGPIRTDTEMIALGLHSDKVGSERSFICLSVGRNPAGLEPGGHINPPGQVQKAFWVAHPSVSGPASGSRPDRVWNRIPEDVRSQIIDLALDLPELSPRELAVRFTDEKQYFVSEASVYRLLKAHDLITSPAYVVIKAANEFKDKTTAINQLWQTDFT